MLLHILRLIIKTKSALCVVRCTLPPRCVLNLNIAPSVAAKKTKHRKYRNCDRLSQLSKRDSYAVETPGTGGAPRACSEPAAKIQGYFSGTCHEPCESPGVWPGCEVQSLIRQPRKLLFFSKVYQWTNHNRLFNGCSTRFVNIEVQTINRFYFYFYVLSLTQNTAFTAVFTTSCIWFGKTLMATYVWTPVVCFVDHLTLQIERDKPEQPFKDFYLYGFSAARNPVAPKGQSFILDQTFGAFWDETKS